jgi:hypothetical protein
LSKQSDIQSALVVEFEALACSILKQKFKGILKVSTQNIKTFFGAPPIVLDKLWDLLMEKGSPWPNGTETIHMLIGFHMIKLYGTLF